MGVKSKGGRNQSGLILRSFLAFFLIFLCLPQITRADLGDWGTVWEDIFAQHGSVILVVEDESGRILRANDAAAAFYGYPKAQLEGMNMEMLHGFSRQEIKEKRREAAEEGRRDLVLDQFLADGSRRTVKFNTSSSQGRVFYIITDITEELAANRRLIANLQRVDRAENIANVGWWEYVLAEDRLLLSEGAQRIVGWPRGEQTMQDTLDHTLAEDLKTRTEALQALIEGGQPYDIQFRLKRASDGAVIIVHSVAEYDSSAGVVFGTFQDVTEDVAKTEALARSKQRNINLLLILLVLQLLAIIVLWVAIRQRKKAQKETQQNLKRTESLVRILQHPTESIQELLDYALEESVTLTKSDYGYIFFYEESKQEFKVYAWSGAALERCAVEEKQLVYHLEKTGIWGEVVRQRRPLVINDFERPHPLKKGYPPGHVPIKKYLTVPIFDGDQIVMAVGLANKETDYDQMDIWQITLLMNNVWTLVQKRRSDLALWAEKERLQATLRSVGDGVIATDKEGRIVGINGVAQELTGWSRRQALGRPFTEVFHILNEHTREKCEDPIGKVLRTGKTVGLANHTVLVARGGRERQIADSAAPIIDARGEIDGVVLVFRDVSEERRKMAEINYLSEHDYLTEVKNRRYFEFKLQELDQSDQLPFSLIMAGFDGLSMVNESFGYAQGDEILRKTARVIEQNCPPDATLARWSGDEFILLLPQTTAAKAEAVSSEIAEALRKESVNSIPLSISLGSFTKNEPGQTTAEMLKEAETRMYRAKLYQSPGIRSQMIDALMSALYEKDPREEKHCKRVSELSQFLGQALGLARREIEELKLIGLFHDIGKVSIAKNILNKPGPLTPEEWLEIKRHPEVGYRVLSKVQDMAEIANYVLAHHERWDGRGYPQGLKGEEIPLQSRIIAVADAYDAMISFRPYKDSLSKEKAIEELKKCAGTQFEPEIVKKFVDATQNLDQAAPAQE
ncbi:MAG: PAS domain S-box protein [Firmicutes bacterium]|nr:PAS domain S-box protein [Bacillota bacterium]